MQQEVEDFCKRSNQIPCECRVRDIIDIVQAIEHQDAERADASHAEQYIICEPKNR